MDLNLTFQLPRDDSVSNLEKRVEKINTFLRNHVKSSSKHRCFGIQLFSPACSINSCNRKSVRKFLSMPEHVGHYLLAFFFFNDKKEEVGNLTSIFDLGEKLEDELKLNEDIAKISALASVAMKKVVLSVNTTTIEISILVDDSTPTYVLLKKHLDFIVENELQKHKLIETKNGVS